MGRLRILLVVLAVAGLAACGEKSAPKPAAQGGEALKTAAVELRDVELTTSAEAVMEAVRQSTVSAQIAGRVVDLRFDVGDYVKKGEVIVRIDERSATRALEASEAQVLEAQAALANARANYERSRQLLAQKFISQAGLDQAEAAYKSAQARVGALVAGAGAAATERSFATVVAPYSGIVSARHIELGEMASPGRPLMTGFDPSTLRVVCVRGSAAGTMVIAFTSTHRPSDGTSILALPPAWIAATCACGTVAVTRSVPGSNPVISALPGVAISPSSTWRADTMPL